MKKMKDLSAALAPTSDICSTREAAQLLGVSLRTVQLWVESGVLEAWKTVGGHRRITVQSVEKLMEDRLKKNAPRSAAPFRMLVLEDDPSLLKLYQMTIEGWDSKPEVLTASNGFEGLIEIGKSSPDLLITDLKMPGMDGFELLRHLKRDPRHQGMHIVVVTGLGKQDIAAGALPKDVTVFSKPVPFPELESLVRGLIIGASKATGMQ
ncbi:MAG: response regulator [Sulfuricellaceae bacterium]|jgi:excisionase family DNA binding protein